MSMAGTEPRGDATLRGFARQIAKLQRDLRILETAAQGAYRSVEEGSVDFYDEDGVLRERVGKQKDGSYGRVTLDGPVPPTPSEPDVVVIDNGVVAITWDGRTDEKWPTSEFRMVRVHLGDTATFTPTRNNQVGAIHAQRGGTIVAVTESDDDNPVYVRLVAVSRAGHTSDPSDAVLVDELDEDDLADEDEELEWEDGDGHTLTAGDVAAGTVTFGLSHLPEEKSVIAFVNGVHQRPSSYSVNYETPSLTWPLDGWEPEGARMSVQYPYFAGPPASDVVPNMAWYRLGEASGTTLVDSGPGGHNGTYQGGVTLGTAGLFGATDKAATFNGTTGMAVVPYTNPDAYPFGGWMDNGTADGAFTISAHIKPTAVNGNRTIVGRRGVVWDLLVSDGKLAFVAWQSGTIGTGITGTTPIVAGQEYRVAATMEEFGELRIYVNGVLDGSVAFPYEIRGPVNDDLSIGGATISGGIEFFAGVIDEVKWFSYLVDPSQIGAL